MVVHQSLHLVASGDAQVDQNRQVEAIQLRKLLKQPHIAPSSLWPLHEFSIFGERHPAAGGINQRIRQDAYQVDVPNSQFGQ